MVDCKILRRLYQVEDHCLRFTPENTESASHALIFVDNGLEFLGAGNLLHLDSTEETTLYTLLAADTRLSIYSGPVTAWISQLMSDTVAYRRTHNVTAAVTAMAEHPTVPLA